MIYFFVYTCKIISQVLLSLSRASYSPIRAKYKGYSAVYYYLTPNRIVGGDYLSSTVGSRLSVKIARSRRCTASARRSGPLESVHRRYLKNPMIHALSIV